MPTKHTNEIYDSRLLKITKPRFFLQLTLQKIAELTKMKLKLALRTDNNICICVTNDKVLYPIERGL